MARYALAVIIGLLLTGSAFADTPRSRSELTVAVMMGPCALGPTTLLVARRELASLWQPYGVAFAWVDRLNEAEGAALVLKLTCDDEGTGQSERAGHRPLGATFRVGKLWRRLIVIAPGAIMTLVRQMTGGSGDLAAVESLHARLVGRVIAHELGHILLDTVGHSPSGLMRNSYTKRDVVEGGREPYRLGPEEIARLSSATRNHQLYVAER